jgi:CheY-like chemotaxis protein
MQRLRHRQAPLGQAQSPVAGRLASARAMAGEKRKSFLFVDDDAGFLTGIRELFLEMGHGQWEIFTAPNHSEALALLAKRGVDVVVVDIGMPVMDGIQFLQLLGRTHPSQKVVMLTALATDENRRVCLENGASLFLEKPVAADGFASVFAALDALAGAQPQGGFRGMMRRVGLQEVLQLECLGRRSSLLEIFTGKVRGRIFICDGAIVHAESGSLRGEVALYGLLALRGGEFNLLPFMEPPRRTIEGQWESLLMEAARLTDEGQKFLEPDEAEPAAATLTEPRPGELAPLPASQVRIEEVVLCSGTGEVLHEWESKSLELRLRLLVQLEQQTAQLSTMAPVGRFDRLEIMVPDGRIVCQVQPDRRLFVRSAGTPAAPA